LSRLGYFIEKAKLRMRLEEYLAEKYSDAGFGGVTITETPLGTYVVLHVMRPGRIIGRHGMGIKELAEELETRFGLKNPQITVVEVEVPELNPHIMASRIASALERGVHYRRAIFWALRRIMEAGALGAEIVVSGKLRSDRSRFEKVTAGYLPKAGEPAMKYVRKATVHVKLKPGVYGVKVRILPPGAEFPDRVEIKKPVSEEEFVVEEGEGAPPSEEEAE